MKTWFAWCFKRIQLVMSLAVSLTLFSCFNRGNSEDAEVFGSNKLDCFNRLADCTTEAIHKDFQTGWIAFHLTRTENVASILEKGLCPSFGGGDKGLCQSYRDSSWCIPKLIAEYRKESKGHIFFTPCFENLRTLQSNMPGEQLSLIVVRSTGIACMQADKHLINAFKTNKKVEARDLVVIPYTGYDLIDRVECFFTQKQTPLFPLHSFLTGAVPSCKKR